MDVRCERCSTEYEFDEALVSEQGTSVRCTQCGFKFRVKREGNVTPEIWVVRTVDGRELEFRALRDLKISISSGRIGRDDVLSRGAGRPRRLASIAELEPFFITPGGKLQSTQMGLGDLGPVRPRSLTPHGLGPGHEGSDPGFGGVVVHPPTPHSAAQVEERSEGSVAIPLPRYETPRLARNPNPNASTNLFGTPASLAKQEPVPPSIEPDTRKAAKPPGRRQSTRPMASGAIGGFSDDEELTEAKAARVSARNSIAQNAITQKTSAQAITDNAITQRNEVGPVSAAEPEPSTHRKSVTTGRHAVPPQAPPQSRPPVVVPLPRELEDDVPTNVGGQVQNFDEIADEPTDAPLLEELQPEEQPEPSAEQREGSVSRDASRDTNFDEDDRRPPTPTPNESRFSLTSEDTSSEVRMTTLAPSRGGGGSGRLIVGLLIAGALVFCAVLLVQKFVLHPTNQNKGAPDGRIVSLVSESEKSLREGDFDAANESLVKASTLSDSDPTVAKALAHLANARAEVPCLRTFLLAETDDDRDASVSECHELFLRSEKAVAKAISLAPQDPGVIREQIDARRLGGDVAGARQLVDSISSIGAEPSTALVLAALDLSEHNPPWPSVVDRLNRAATDEGNLGRARALLVYALARSGDGKQARVELEKLGKLPRPHPLRGALAKFIERVAKGEVPVTRIDELPSATPGSSGAPSTASGQGSVTSAVTLQNAHEAFQRRDYTRAASIYQTILDKDPGNTEAMAGLAAVEKAQGHDGKAQSLYEKTVNGNSGYVPALVSLADMKWESGDHAGAAAIYSRVIELEPTGADADRARIRIAAHNAEPPPTAPANPGSSSSGGDAPPTPPTPTPTPPPNDGSTSGAPAPAP